MEKFEIVINLEHVAEQRKLWNEAAHEFGERVDTAMKRLIHEAAAARMSVPEVAKSSGFSGHQIKQRMKTMGLNPSTGKTLLSKQAASVLESNAEIMGIKPSEIDLMSPLAYLPAGPALKHSTADVHKLDEISFPETFVDELRVHMAEDRLRALLNKAYLAGYSTHRKELDYEPDLTIDEIMAEADEVGA